MFAPNGEKIAPKSLCSFRRVIAFDGLLIEVITWLLRREGNEPSSENAKFSGLLSFPLQVRCAGAIGGGGVC